jgi:hypothetical protein
LKGLAGILWPLIGTYLYFLKKLCNSKIRVSCIVTLLRTYLYFLKELAGILWPLIGSYLLLCNSQIKVF